MKNKILPETRFVNLVILSLAERDKKGNAVYSCRCDCGKIIFVLGYNLKSGNTKSCGCVSKTLMLRSRKNNNGQFALKDLTNKRFGFLIAQSYNGQQYWKCLCECDTTKNIRSDHLYLGLVRSCGCKSQNMLEDFCLLKYGFIRPSQNKDIQRKIALSQRSKTIKYHWKTGEQLVCQSSWEPKVIDYLNQNKIDFDFQIPFDMPDGRRYFIDLYLAEQDLWVEIKGYFRGDAKEKWEWFHRQHPNSELWDKNKLKELKIL